jgi:hypothetical protein
MPRDKHGKPVGDETMSEAGMAHMKREKKTSGNKAMAGSMDEPPYPYGLKIHLDHEDLKKAGIESMPEVGGDVHLRAKARVVGARAEKTEGDSERRHLELQITHLGVHHAPDGMKSQAQGGSGKTASVGKPSTDKGREGAGKTAKEPSYARKRH